MFPLYSSSREPSEWRAQSDKSTLRAMLTREISLSLYAVLHFVRNRIRNAHLGKEIQQQSSSGWIAQGPCNRSNCCSLQVAHLIVVKNSIYSFSCGTVCLVPYGSVLINHHHDRLNSRAIYGRDLFTAGASASYNPIRVLCKCVELNYNYKN